MLKCPDHGMIALLYKTAYRLGIKHILTGVNVSTESLLPLRWGYGYFDLRYIKGIQKSLELKKLNLFQLYHYFNYFSIQNMRYKIYIISRLF